MTHDLLHYVESRSKVVGSCRVWQLSLHRQGYGQARIWGKLWLVHRLVYVVTHGPIPNEWDILHSCDNPPCNLPEHLFRGDAQSNMLDMYSKQRRSQVGTSNGNVKFSIEDVLAIRAERATGQYTLAEIGAKYGTSREHVHAIVTRKAWKHV